MNQMFSWTQPNPPMLEGNQTTPVPTIRSPVVNLLQTPNDINLAEGETSKSIEKEIEKKLDSLEKQIC